MIIGLILGLVGFYLLGCILTWGRLTAISYEACEKALYRHPITEPTPWWKIPLAFKAGKGLLWQSWVSFRFLVRCWENNKEKYLLKWSYKPLQRRYDELNKSSEDRAKEILDQIDW